MEAILKRLRQRGCTLLAIDRLPNAYIVGLASRDVISFLTPRTPEIQRFCDRWKGAPPVDVTTVAKADELCDAIMAGEFDADSRYQRDQIILRMRQ